MIRPSNNPVTMEFGSTAPPYSASSPHKGVDFGWRDSAGNENKTLVMPVSATVTLVLNNGADGNGVYFTGEGFSQGLLHTSQYLIGNGTYVEKGQPVAIMGETGAADGVHCHWAVRQGNTYVNGLDYVEEEPIDMEYKMNGGDVVNRYHQFFGMSRPVSQEEVDAFTGKTYKEFDDNCLTSNEYKRLTSGGAKYKPINQTVYVKE